MLSQYGRCLPEWSLLGWDGQDVCELARSVIFECSPRQPSQFYPLPALNHWDGEHQYPAPLRRQTSYCLCTMPTYNLIQACAACQSHPQHVQPSMSWAEYSANCPPRDTTAASFAASAPGVAVPAWALEDNSKRPTNIFLAFKQVLDHMSPNKTSLFAQSTATVTVFDTTPAPTSDSATVDSSVPRPRSMPHFVIVLTVLVSVFGLGMLTGVGFVWRARRGRRRQLRQGTRLRSSSDVGSTAVNEMRQTAGRGASLHAASASSWRALGFTSRSRVSLDTNSVSSGKMTGYGGGDVFGWGSASSAFDDDNEADSDVESSVSSAFRSSHHFDERSPFSEVHRPEAAQLWRSTVYERDSLLSRTPSVRTEVSSLTLSSDVAPPSSVGATFDASRASLR
ncbi:hypothetical protein ACM66B_003546 [Microbotryomycetes sp. NB124-2]